MARHEREKRPLPAHPYRDTAIVYGIMAVSLVVIAGITGGSLVRAIGVGTVFWLLATGWAWWKFRGRIRQRDLAATTAASGAAAPESGIEVPEAGGTVRPGSSMTDGTVNGAVGGAVGENGSRRGAATGTGEADA